MLIIRLCWPPSSPHAGHNEERDKTEPLVLKWADTEEGNVELLAMKTLSETLHDPQDNKVEETKNESVDKETGELTAGTFGFEGKVIKIEETVTVSVDRVYACRF